MKTLKKKITEDRPRREIQESVRRCAAADRKETRQLFPASAEETSYLVSNPRNAKRLRRAIRQLEAGKGKARKLIR